MQLLSDATNAPSVSACALDVLDAMPPLTWFIRRRMREHRRGLSVPQFRVLVYVDRRPTASLSAVAEFLGASLPTASRLVAGLVGKGLLKRTGCPNDRRQMALAITARGQSVLRGAWAGTQAAVAAELEGLTAAQRTTVAAAMAILGERFGRLGLADEAVALTDPAENDSPTDGAVSSSES